MGRWPVQPREGFTGFPNAVLARAIGELTPQQFRLFVGLVYSAEWRPEGSISPDGRWRIGRGQVLVSYDTLAAKFSMDVQAVRRALRRFEGVSVGTSTRAPPVTPGDTSTGTPPTLVDFGSWFGIQAAAKSPNTPPDSPSDRSPDTSPDTIQEGNTGNTETHLAGRPAREREGDGNGASAAHSPAAEVERLQQDLGAYLGRKVYGPGKAIGRLGAEIERLGYDEALAAAKEVADELARKGDPLRGLAALPGWLATVEARP